MVLQTFKEPFDRSLDGYLTVMIPTDGGDTKEPLFYAMVHKNCLSPW